MPHTRTLTYMALSTLASRWSAVEPDVGWRSGAGLTASELRVFSQNGEDGVIQAILGHVGTSSRRFIEFGAEDGREGNCAFLAAVLGWSGLFIEPDPAAFARLEARYRDHDGVVTVNQAVTPTNINGLISSAGLSGDVDVLSIDIDGHDYWVWQAITVVRPRLVVIEYNAHIPYPARRVQPLSESGPWRGTDYFGASLGALEFLASELGYVLVHTDLAGVNAFFVPEELAGGLPTGENVPRRSPNFFLLGEGHPPDDSGREWVDPSG